MKNSRILVVDDEETLCETLQLKLELEGYEVDVAYSAEEALQLDLTRYALILLDVMMDKISGFEMARKMRSNPATVSIPIIFCTALDTEDDMISGLQLGADDYIPKPYSLRNVVARVESVLRRANKPANENVITYEGLALDNSQKTCTVDGEPVRLPRKEFELLALLMSQRGKVFSREEILKAVWPEEVVVVNRVVDVNITRLRGKIGRYGKMIVTRSGYGYGFIV